MRLRRHRSLDHTSHAIAIDPPDTGDEAETPGERYRETHAVLPTPSGRRRIAVGQRHEPVSQHPARPVARGIRDRLVDISAPQLAPAPIHQHINRVLTPRLRAFVPHNAATTGLGRTHGAEAAVVSGRRGVRKQHERNDQDHAPQRGAGARARLYKDSLQTPDSPRGRRRPPVAAP